ncbi:hypothetical protein OV090_25145 [Nannocystis sp. RBIL2]|uniref:hypothetical protein n=1 Tax=Nannocystis sp. RBIL2 TaxID=2996788 RepID=UPI00226E818A|nr:hypothetical protein [Nannocystis sp. RBIL2]MCY1068053.1 hypothetical protein [Nannocystis sp. RBIL2]
MPRPSLLAPVAAASLAVACGDSTATTGFTTTPSTTMPPLSTSGADSSGGTSSTSTSTSTGSGSGGEDSTAGSSSTSMSGVSDVGSIPDFPSTPGCKGKIDFLFVISSNYEMSYHQVQLQEAFPEFVKILEADFADFDYHVMVVDASLPFLPSCDICYSCSQVMCEGPGCSQWDGPPDYPCNEIFEECTGVYGAGVTIVGNFDASNTRCLPAEGPRFITRDDPDLKGTFDCISKLGAGPKEPKAARSMLKALEPEILSKWGCNKGFLRPDALLAIVIVAGEDGLTPGTPAEWYADVLEAKQGNEDALVTLVFSHDRDLPDPKCEGPEAGANVMRLFAEEGKHGRFASMCEPSYVPFMQEMAGTILEQCSVFIPPQ